MKSHSFTESEYKEMEGMVDSDMVFAVAGGY